MLASAESALEAFARVNSEPLTPEEGRKAAKSESSQRQVPVKVTVCLAGLPFRALERTFIAQDLHTQPTILPHHEAIALRLALPIQCIFLFPLRPLVQLQ